MTTYEFNSSLLKNKNVFRSYAYKLTRNVQDAEDLFQDTYLRAFNYKERFSNSTNFKAWVCTIMRNIFINAYRRSIRKIDLINNSLEGEPFYESTAVTEIDNLTEREELKKAIEKLKEDYKFCFQKFFEGYKYKEIAEELNTPIGNIKSNIHFARKKLKEQFSL